MRKRGDEGAIKRVSVRDSSIAYIEMGQKTAPNVVFLHGNPTSSFLWRNVIPHVIGYGRCLAPDLIGMGQSGKAPEGGYRFLDHAAYLDAWFDAIVADGRVVLVGHDWGSALGFHWAHRHPDRVAGIAYMEAIVKPMSWDDWPEAARGVFRGFRSDAGEKMVLDQNLFVERVLPGSINRTLTDDEMAAYRAPFNEPGEGRRPTLSWPREIPIEGEPADVCQIVADYGAWLSTSPIPKLFINAEPGAILVGRQRELCRSWPNQEEVTIEGVHFVQEDSPDDIGRAVARLVQSVT